MSRRLPVLISIIFILIFVSISLVNAESSSCNPEIKLINQDPSPAIPNSYVKVIFEVTGLENCGNGYAVRLNPEYPFSLDSNSSAGSTIEGNPYVVGYKNTWMIPYQIRVAGDALDGDYSLRLDYHEGNDNSFVNYAEEIFNITIQDSRTDFDAVIQETSGNDVSIAIANVGKYTANSVVVRIPEQDSFRVTGTDGQMVGNLESGDYTIVGFTVSPQGAFSRNASRTNQQTTPQPSSSKLKFDIYYTDNIGERRVVNMELPLSMGNSTIGVGNGVGNFANRRTTQNSSSWYSALYSSWIIWVVILGILVVLYILYKKYPKQSKDFLNKIKSKIKRSSRKEGAVSHNANKTPDWIRNAKEKEKKK
jgi:hypothetical protein